MFLASQALWSLSWLLNSSLARKVAIDEHKQMAVTVFP